MWNTVMYDCMRAAGWPACFYFVTLVLFGNTILLNLFLAIILGNFEEANILRRELKLLKGETNNKAKG